MHNKLKRLQSNIGGRIITIRNSWAYNHPREIVIASLVVVVLWQHHQPTITMPSLTSEVIAFNEKEDTSHLIGECDYKCLTREWVEMRTDEILAENQERYRQQARIEALIEANELITSI